jgi:tetratricopeptide (TPR) repeat protein
VTTLRTRFLELPARLRWTLVGGAAVLVVVLAGAGAREWIERREAAGQAAIGRATTVAEQALRPGGPPGALEGAAATLEQVLREHGRSRAAAQAQFLLGRVEMQRGRLDAAATAFREASERGHGTVAALAWLGLGQVYEAKGEPSRAAEVYRRALEGRVPKDFLVGELRVARGRALDLAKDTAGAVEAYRQFLKDDPGSPRAEEVRIRLGLLGASSS